MREILQGIAGIEFVYFDEEMLCGIVSFKKSSKAYDRHSVSPTNLSPRERVNLGGRHAKTPRRLARIRRQPVPGPIPLMPGRCRHAPSEAASPLEVLTKLASRILRSIDESRPCSALKLWATFGCVGSIEPSPSRQDDRCLAFATREGRDRRQHCSEMW